MAPLWGVVMAIVKEQDTEYEETTVTAVEDSGEYWAFEHDDGWWLSFEKRHGVEPKVGDTVRTYGRGVGYGVRGIDLNGVEVYYRSPEQDAEHHRQAQIAMERERQIRFEQQRPDLELRFAVLPPVFQQRIQGFRDWRPDWRERFEGYELFTCEQAVAIATALPSKAQIEAFYKLDWEEQAKRVPALSDQHSGNTFGVACRLATLSIATPELIPLAHGALDALVGCSEYGCWAVRQEAS